MKRKLYTVLLLVAVGALGAQENWLGRWDGEMLLSDGAVAFSVLVARDGALLDIPTQELYGYPSAGIEMAPAELKLGWQFGGGQLVMQLGAGTQAQGAAFTGRFAQGGIAGSLSFSRSPRQPDSARAYDVRMPDGALLPGELVLPLVGGSRAPIVILHAGLGAADRDGNNYNVPGTSDSLKQLAEALAIRGIASYRYDKRGAGLASWLVPAEKDLSFEAWIRDLGALASHFSKDRRFSGVWLLGMNDGAVIAMAAANAGAPAKGAIVACSSAESMLDSYEKAIKSAPAEMQAEGTRILDALLRGTIYPAPSPFFEASFRPSFQPYLMEAFRHDIKDELRRYGGPVLLIQGDMDMQATLADFMALGEASPSATPYIVPYMNHVFKDVSPDVEENYAAFSDPSFPLSQAFADTIATFVFR